MIGRIREALRNLFDRFVPERGRAVRVVRAVPPFLGFMLKRFNDDRCLRMAASLSYTSLLAVVPLTAIAFSMLAAFPVFEGVRNQFQEALFSNFLPQSAAAMREYFDQFVQNTARLTAVGIVGLAATAVLLLGTIEADLNAIFRVSQPRAVVPRLLVFWALITLGPLLLGASFSLSTYFFAITSWLGVDSVQTHIGELTGLLPALMVIVALTFCYIIVPNRRIGFVNAMIGGIVAGLLFAALRRGFGMYVAKFPTYQTIYGAVSVVPIFLVWMYLSWAVVLLGAVLTAAMGEWRAGVRRASGPLSPEERLSAALGVLDNLFRASHTGRRMSRGRLHARSGVSGEVMDDLLATLQKAGILEQTRRGDWVLIRDLGSVTLFDLMRYLGLTLGTSTAQHAVAAWQERLGDRLADLDRHQKSAAGLSLRELLEDGARQAAGTGVPSAAD